MAAQVKTWPGRPSVCSLCQSKLTRWKPFKWSKQRTQPVPQQPLVTSQRCVSSARANIQNDSGGKLICSSDVAQKAKRNTREVLTVESESADKNCMSLCVKLWCVLDSLGDFAGPQSCVRGCVRMCVCVSPGRLFAEDYCDIRRWQASHLSPDSPLAFPFAPYHCHQTQRPAVHKASEKPFRS